MDHFARLGLPPSLELDSPSLDKAYFALQRQWHPDRFVGKPAEERARVQQEIAQAYERRSLIITSNQPFGQWETLFQDKAMTVAAIDRLVHHAVILEMTGESHRRRQATATAKR